MWLFCEQGFFSLSRSPVEPAKLQVRARFPTDITRLRRIVPELGEPIFSKTADYPIRALVEHEALGAGLNRIAHAIDYSNFKQRILAVDGKARESVYFGVWAQLLDLQDLWDRQQGGR